MNNITTEHEQGANFTEKKDIKSLASILVSHAFLFWLMCKVLCCWASKKVAGDKDEMKRCRLVLRRGKSRQVVTEKYHSLYHCITTSL